LIGLPIQKDFPGYGSFSGKVTGWDTKENYGMAILHEVLFSDGEIGEYSFSEIMRHHEDYLKIHVPNSAAHVLLPNATSPFTEIRRNTPEPNENSVAGNIFESLLPLPRSFESYPLRLPVDGSMVQGKVVARRIDASGVHEWRVQLPAPHLQQQYWIDTQTFHSHMAKARKSCKINAPSRSPPTLSALKEFSPLSPDSQWMTHHALIGLVLSTSQPAVATGLPESSKKCLHSVFVEAVFIPSSENLSLGAKTQCWGRVQNDPLLG